MKSELNYVTYQTFPAKTANSLQTITNIKYLIRNGTKIMDRNHTNYKNSH